MERAPLFPSSDAPRDLRVELAAIGVTVVGEVRWRNRPMEVGITG
jgi:hypothetical protein